MMFSPPFFSIPNAIGHIGEHLGPRHRGSPFGSAGQLLTKSMPAAVFGNVCSRFIRGHFVPIPKEADCPISSAYNDDGNSLDLNPLYPLRITYASRGILHPSALNRPLLLCCVVTALRHTDGKKMNYAVAKLLQMFFL